MYSTNYYDPEERQEKLFICYEESLNDRPYCIFHSGFNEDSETARKRFTERVHECMYNDKPLICIGFFIPETTIKGRFTKPVYLIKSVIDGIDLSGVEFSSGVYFYHTKFSRRAIFYETVFASASDFYGTYFEDDAVFNRSKFVKEAYFSRATFGKGLYFFRARFLEEAIISECEMKDITDFSQTRFRNVDFSRTIFGGKTSFDAAVFEENSNFTQALFSAYVNFYRCSFQSASFLETRFENRTDFIYVTIRGDELVDFDFANLANVSFTGTDITRIAFGANVTFGGIDGLTMADENRIEESIEPVAAKDLENIVSTYSSMRDNCLNRRRYELASRYLIKQNEIRRKYGYSEGVVKKKKWVHRNFSLYGLYYHASRYGEDYARPLLGALFILFLSTFYWSMYSNANTHDLNASNISTSNLLNQTNIRVAFERTIADFFQTTYDEDFVLSDYVVRVASAIWIGMAFLEAIRRRLRQLG
jgi:uncharacterized protein YjbI with pentapeptide repeats